MTENAYQEMIKALAEIQPLRQSKDPALSHQWWAYWQYDPYLGSLICPPRMLELMRRVLGLEIRFDHVLYYQSSLSSSGFRLA